ncbi:tail fiber assembly protein [Providencia rettgeri]|nr:tail fiber assembly protein [Providencia manganoxydans]MDV5224809.1 tail fiber assembly protein [Providencia rettgeri]MDX4945185.1 tail fiber assembly protein [Providencia manganoxydans]
MKSKVIKEQLILDTRQYPLNRVDTSTAPDIDWPKKP